MVVKELMGWVATQKRWVKKYRGKQYFVSPRQLGTTDSTKEASRTAANEWWKKKLESIDAASPNSQQESWPALRRKELADLLRSNGDIDAAKKVEAQSDEETRNGFASQLADKIIAHKLGIDLDTIESIAVLEDRKARKAASVNRTVRFHATEFLQHKETQAKAGVLSVGRWGALDPLPET